MAGGGQTYTVQKGDTLSAVARRNGTTVSEIQRLNGIQNPDVINEGETLAMPTPAPPAKPPAAAKGADAGEEAAKGKSDAAPGTPVKECPLKKKQREKKLRLGGDENVDVLYLSGKGDTGGNAAGAYAEGEVGVGMVNMDHSGNFGDSAFGGAHKMEAFTADAKGRVGGGAGFGAQGSAGARVIKEEGSLFVGDEANPYIELGGGYELVAAEAKGGVLLGTDGRLYGVMAKGALKATPASGDLGGEINVPIPFTDWTVSLRAKTGLAAEAGLGAHGFWDSQSGRVHAGGGAKLGVGLDFDLSVGPKYEDRGRPAVLYSSGGGGDKGGE